MRQPIPLCLLALSLAAAPLQAQATGRWALLLGGGVRGMVRGELRLSARSGTLWLETDSAPVPLQDVRVNSDGVEFTRAGAVRLRFTGIPSADVLRGSARADTGAPRIWTATRLQEIAEYYPMLPRFTLRQIVAGRRDTVETLPGMWVAAARATPDDAVARYDSLARAAGLDALSGDRLQRLGPQRVLGLAQRDAMVAAATRTLQQIRAQIPDGATRAVFDRLFHPADTWIVDLHDAALSFARAGMRRLTFDDARPALTAIGWLPADAAHDDTAVMAALYRLHGLGESDSVMVRQLLDAMRRVDPAHAAAALTLFRAYDAAEQWHSAALGFLLFAPWIGDGGPRSITARMRASWGDSLPLPLVTTHYFGSAQAVPRYGVPAPFFDRLVRTDNWSARQWLDRHHPAALLETLRLLPEGGAPDAEVEGPNETFRLSTVREEAASRDNGFLEPEDAIAVDPGYMPLLALAASVHEWEHLAFERRRRLRESGDTAAVVTLRGSDPYVAEGVAEWRADVLLRPLAEQFPLLLAGEAEKRVRLAATGVEPHALGFRLVRALARVVPDPATRLRLLLDAADTPTGVTSEPAVRSAWAAYHAAPDLTHRGAGRRVLVPETTFTVEDGFPDPVALRVRVEQRQPASE
jgi:hypothetical protein